MPQIWKGKARVMRVSMLGEDGNFKEIGQVTSFNGVMIPHEPLSPKCSFSCLVATDCKRWPKCSDESGPVKVGV